MRNLSFRLGLFALAALAVPGFGQPQVIFSSYATSPTSQVPGGGGLQFKAGTAVFERPFGSPDGTRWALTALNNSGVAATDQMLITGTGLTASGAQMVVREGNAVPFEPASTWGLIDNALGINNAGQIAFTADVQPATTLDQVLVRVTGGTFEQVTRDGQPAVGISGVNYGATFDSVHILGNGDVRFRSTLNPTTSGGQAVTNLTNGTTGSVLVQATQTVPTGQTGGTVAPVSTVLADGFASDTAGANTLYRATLNTSTTNGFPFVPTANDVVLVRNGAVVAQEGVVLPGSGFASPVLNVAGTSGQLKVSATGGHYVAQGSNADATDWVIRNGAVVAQTDAPIFPGSPLNWDDAAFAATFFLSAVNNNGDYVVGGLTNNPDATRDAVLVLNGTRVLVQENDFVAFDVDGNGTVDAGEGKFIRIFNNDDAFLTATHLYLTVDLADTVGATASTGQAFLVVPLNPVPEPSLGLLAAGIPVAVAAWRRRRKA
jgi:hypothetical protein